MRAASKECGATNPRDELFPLRPQLPNDWSYTTLTSRRRLVRWTNSYSLGALVRNTHGGSEVFSVFLERSALHVLVLGLFRPAKAVPGRCVVRCWAVRAASEGSLTVMRWTCRGGSTLQQGDVSTPACLAPSCL